jgi:hypothetical protein
MSSTEKTPPCPPTRQEQSCPPWCTQAHLSQTPDVDGIYHDAEIDTVDVAASGGQLFVSTSQFIPDRGPAQAPLVELQNEVATIAQLQPLEAISLARALLWAAEQAIDA